MERAGVPLVPGALEEVVDVAAARAAAQRYGLPLALKAAGGGGGKGLKVARTLDEIASAFETARREAEAYFKNGTIYAERVPGESQTRRTPSPRRQARQRRARRRTRLFAAAAPSEALGGGARPNLRRRARRDARGRRPRGARDRVRLGRNDRVLVVGRCLLLSRR